jgi:hypothetical protein
MTPGHDALPASSVGYDPSDPVRTNPPAASGFAGTAPVIEENTPVLDSLTPDTGLEAGGESIVLAGSHFTGAEAVLFGSTPATSFVVDNDEQITAVAPAGAAGAVDVTVRLSEAFRSEGVAYTYTAA